MVLPNSEEERGDDGTREREERVMVLGGGEGVIVLEGGKGG